MTVIGAGTAGPVQECYRMNGMQELVPWLTPALVIALFAWLRTDLRELRREMNSRFDENGRQIGDLRERMAKLEGALEGFLAGRRDRDAA